MGRQLIDRIKRLEKEEFRWLMVVLIASVVFFVFLYQGSPARGTQNLEELEPDQGPLALIDGARWHQELSWNFSKGTYPGAWDWGEWKIYDGLLHGTDSDGSIVVYFLPFSHGPEFVLETKVMFPGPAEGRPTEAHLLTRNNHTVSNESGLVIFAGEAKATVRNRVEYREWLWKTVKSPVTLNYDQWYVIRFMIHNGRVKTYVDDLLIQDSPAAPPQESHPRIYHEPHLAVRYGTAVFEHFKVFTLPGRDEMWAYSVDPRPVALSHALISVPFFREGEKNPLITVMLWTLLAIILLICFYIIRHYSFTLSRLFGRQRQPYIDVDTADWPEVTILVPAHNEETVIGEILEALLEVDYPWDRLTVTPINDRATDRTEEIINDFAERYPDVVRPFHRRSGKPGKAAALHDATERVETDIVLVFDADYIPGKGLIKQLAAPFFDPEVGAVMGRVVPYNVDANLLTRLLDLERSAGYQVDQQARMNMRLVPQYGGTVGGIRKRALQSVGGWRGDALAEDTDATYRLLLAGWKTVYQNRSECYEQVPETWTSRLRQIGRWAQGHNQATTRYSHQLLFNPRMRLLEKLDGLLLLGVYTMSPILVLGWMLGISLWYMGEWSAGLIIILSVTSYSTLGNFAIFFEVVAAANLDGSRARIRLMPFIFLGFLVSLFSVTRATLAQVFPSLSRRDFMWHKTEHKNNHNNHHVNHKPNQHLEKYYNNHNSNHNHNYRGPANNDSRRDA